MRGSRGGPEAKVEKRAGAAEDRPSASCNEASRIAAPIDVSTDSHVDTSSAASARQRRLENESSAAIPTEIRSIHSVGACSSKGKGRRGTGRRARISNCRSRQRRRLTERYRSGQTGQTVNLLAHAFGGSNPPLSTTETSLGRGPSRVEWSEAGLGMRSPLARAASKTNPRSGEFLGRE